MNSLRTVSEQRTPRYTEICQVTVGNPRSTAESENGTKNIRIEKIPPRLLHARTNFTVRFPMEGIKGKNEILQKTVIAGAETILSRIVV